MLTLVMIAHVSAALFIIFVVLMQGGSSGGLGAGFGGGTTGGDSQSLFGAAGPTSFLGKLTYVFAVVFMVTSISLTIMQGTDYDIGLKEKLKKATDTSPEKEK